mmetsp:Transcript_52514/g.112293  ORF Transcript_52514/g.112293 Transcript_52514/m.112293 type:complete len:221 (+) Transcript_52514:38-700(+)
MTAAGRATLRPGESAGSLIFGGGAADEPRRLPSARAISAGPPRESFNSTPRDAFQTEGERRQRAPRLDLARQYDDYINATDDVVFSKMRQTLGKLEIRAAREFQHYQGAAGWSSGQLAERAESKEDGTRRERLRASSAHQDSSMSSLFQTCSGNEARHHRESCGAKQQRPRSATPRSTPVPPLSLHRSDSGRALAEDSLAARIASRRRQSSARRIQPHCT